MNSTIGFAGLSHLGIVHSITTASKGNKVIAYDPDDALCTALGKGELPVYEPGLEALLASNKNSINFTSDLGILKKCSLIFFSMDIPTSADGQSDLSPLNKLAEKAFDTAEPKTALVVLSQVPPGFTRGLADALESQWLHKGLSLFYQVETLVFGNAVERALEPERIIVGAAESGAAFPEIYEDWLSSYGCPVLPMRYESAELAKISINIMLASSVSATNTMAELCEAIGADWNEIAPALRMDRRIGAHAYLSPGLGLSGGNLERDLATVTTLAAERGTDAGVVEAWLANSRYRRDWLLRTIHGSVTAKCDNPVIALWGLAYKPDTGSTKNSPALSLIEALRPFPFQAYDPQAVLDTTDWPHVIVSETALDACIGADALVVVTPWREFSTIGPGEIAEALRGQVVIDPFGTLDRRRFQGFGVSYHSLGSRDVNLAVNG